jgi:eukaryotic-like serine/threonine-protein kinase
MSACPNEDLLLGLLNERLEDLELSELVAHVENCQRCQQHLEETTRGHGWNSTLEELAGDSSRDHGAGARATSQLEGDRAVDVVGIDRINELSDDTGQEGDNTDPAPLALQPVNRSVTITEDGFSDDRPARENERARTGRPEVPGYEITERLGEGGMGVVYKARHLGLNRLVALKMIRGGNQAHPDYFVRFLIEAKAVARLRHPNILQIYDIGEVDGLPFVSLELFEGGSLADRLASTTQPGRPAAELLVTLSQAIHAAHQARIIHRDLKPTNVLFTSDGTPKITDFGLAKRIGSDDKQTDSGQIVGSPSYMSPEQARGQSRGVGVATDVYSLGAILYEMLTGRPPFKGETPMETIRQVIDDDPVEPSRLVPRLSRDLETICLKCLHKEPTRRYESAWSLADDLTRFIRGEPILARPRPGWERGVKWVRRRPLAAASWFLGIVFAGGVIAGLFVFQRSELERSQTFLATQTRVYGLAHEADTAHSEETLDDARVHLSEFIPEIAQFKDDRRTKELSDLLTEKQTEVIGRIVEFRSKRAERDQLQTERDRLQKFRALRNEAQLYAARLMVVDPAEHQKILRSTVRAALAIYGQDSTAAATAWSLAQPLPDALNQTDRDEVRNGCCDLLLILSEAEDPTEGLKILDRAARLRREPTVGYHLLRAACLARTNDSAGQAREEQLAHNLKPVNAFDHLLIGREQLARAQRIGRGQLAPSAVREVVHSSQTAIRLDPNQLGAHLLLAVVYFNSQRFSEAKTSLNTCIRTAPDLFGLYLFRALVSGEEGNRALLRLKEPPASAADWQLEAAELFAAAEDDYRHALEMRIDVNFRYILLVNRGGMYLHAGRLDQAQADLEAAVLLNAKPYHAHALLAQVFQQRGRLDQAALTLDRAIERQRDRPELFRARALFVSRHHGKEGGRPQGPTPSQRSQAIRDLDEAIRLEPEDSPQTADDHTERGRLLFASGQTAAAVDAYDAALRIAPESLKALRLRALALLEQEKFDDVLAASDAFLARGKPSADLLEIRGQARLARKEFGGAISDYTVALSLTPGSPALYNRRGWAYLLAEAIKPAVADFEAAVRLDPGLGHAYSGRGLARVSLGRWRDALADVETAVRLASATEKQRAFFNAARVTALSLKFAAAEVTRHGEPGVALCRKLRDRAAALLLQSVQQLPPDRRGAFWRDVVASDPVLRPFIP